ncbi:uncharacterized protein MELLADRAFT_86058 [Melampsora larici-populina 98AG31]|uniref:Acyl-protein thioesterase 1 n=1 Tax=Melampsora larici-populina (strain 98AG31 / pathotype 3-4-7) TaxID=747676 RepID=F4RKM1_MELLP|nr:uncharacterized protein MELLADRAFT_86058 [Melampsora larici-populina 98AG31]EGG07115.1 hypothetical protein MELLADRAFT_86058 [Melampsora larici-populina 98AG31]
MDCRYLDILSILVNIIASFVSGVNFGPQFFHQKNYGTVVFIHGLDSPDSSHGHKWQGTFLSTLQQPLEPLSIRNLTDLRFILPEGRIIPITVYSDQPNGGARPGWFNINDWRDLNYLEDEDGLRRSRIQISTIIAEQVRESKMQMNKIIIAGFDEAPRCNIDADEVLTYNAAKAGFNFLQRISQAAFGRAKFNTITGLAHGFSENEKIAVTNWIEGIVDQDTRGEFDDSLDSLVQPENELDDPQHPGRHSISFIVSRLDDQQGLENTSRSKITSSRRKPTLNIFKGN